METHASRVRARCIRGGKPLDMPVACLPESGAAAIGNLNDNVPWPCGSPAVATSVVVVLQKLRLALRLVTRQLQLRLRAARAIQQTCTSCLHVLCGSLLSGTC